MTRKRKITAFILTLTCFALIIISFQTFPISSGEVYMSGLNGSTGDIQTGELNLLNLDVLAFYFTPLKMISAVVACLSIVVIVLTYVIYRRHYKKSNLKYFSF